MVYSTTLYTNRLPIFLSDITSSNHELCLSNAYGEPKRFSHSLIQPDGLFCCLLCNCKQYIICKLTFWIMDNAQRKLGVPETLIDIIRSFMKGWKLEYKLAKEIEVNNGLRHTHTRYKHAHYIYAHYTHTHTLHKRTHTQSSQL